MYKRWYGLVLTIALLSAVAWRVPDAVGQQCSSTNPPDYNSPYGPTFVLPQWGDSGGWTQSPYYSTIQTGNVDKQPGVELIARYPSGIGFEQFNTTRGQWMTQVAQPSPNGSVTLGWFSDGGSWNQPYYYATIRLADLDGDGIDELVARGSAGIVVFTNKQGADGAYNWTLVNTDGDGPFPDSDNSTSPPTDWTQAKYYTTIQLADINGDGRAELLGRNSQGVIAYSWNGSTWEPLATATGFCDNPCGWDEVSHYETIQFANVTGAQINGHPVFQLLGRGGTGIQIFQYNQDNNSWTWLNPQGGPFPNKDTTTNPPTDWTQPPYYTTIQFADVDGDGKAEALGRGAEGLETWQWTGTGWTQLPTATDFDDGSPGGFDQPQYYSTIQFADIDGKPGAELIARNSAGIIYYFWHGGTIGWGSYTDNPTNQHYGPLLADKALGGFWDAPQYYSTIQTGDVDGEGQAELLARGIYGIRTWRYDAANDTWEPYLTYGSFPPFSGNLENAYLAINGFLVTGAEDLRTRYCSSTISGLVIEYQTCLTDSLIASTIPPTLTCLQLGSQQPLDSSNVSSADWTTVATQLIAELGSVNSALDHFTNLTNMNTQLFLSQDSEGNAVFPDLEKDLHLAEAQNNTAGLSFLKLYVNLLGHLGGFSSPEGVATKIAADAFGTATDGVSASTPSFNTDIELTYGEIEQQLGTFQGNLQDQIAAQHQYVLGDAGLFTTVGELVVKGIWNIDQNAYISVGRQQFATWIYQAFLPTIWANYGITNCTGTHGNGWISQCAPPPNGAYMQSYTNGGVDFTGLLSRASECATTSSGGGQDSNCDWVVPDSTVTGYVWGTISPACTYDPADASPNFWTYCNSDTTGGCCNLGLSPIDTVNNQNGWSFTSYLCDINTDAFCPANTGLSLAGQAGPLTSKQGTVEMSGELPLFGDLDLSTATVTIALLLNEAGGGGELAHGPNGEAFVPFQLSPQPGNQADYALFTSPAKEKSSVHLQLLTRDGMLQGRLSMSRAALEVPQLCAEGTATELHTRIAVNDGVHRPVSWGTIGSWECQATQKKSKHTTQLQTFDWIFGDLNGDGIVDQNDVTLLRVDLTKPVEESQCGLLCDFNNDGKITAQDTRELEKLCTHQKCTSK